MVEVRAAQQAGVVVHQQRLGVQHARTVFEHLHAGGDQLVVIRTRRRADDARVAARGHHHPHVESAQRRRRQRHARGFARHEIRRHQPDPPVRLVDGLDLHPVDRLPGRVRTGRQHLGEDAACFQDRPKVFVAQRDPAGVMPILQEGQLQPAHHFALQAQVQVVVGGGIEALVLLVGDVDAAGESHRAVHHHQLAVVAQVDPRPPDPAQPHRMEPGQLDAGGQQRRQEAPRQPRRTDRIEQQAHAHAGLRAFDQGVAQQGAAAVGFEDVVLDVHVVPGRGDGVEQGVVGRRAVHQQVDPGRGGRCVAGAGLAQAGDGGAVLAGREPGRQRAVQAGPRARAPQRLAPDALRPKEVVDHQAQHRQQRQRHDPAQGGDRFALLQHDPAGQHHQVGDPDARQHGLELGPEFLKIHPLSLRVSAPETGPA